MLLLAAVVTAFTLSGEPAMDEDDTIVLLDTDQTWDRPDAVEARLGDEVRSSR